uniref:very-long-chain 3-oxoacyl-CoA reductase-like n=1 Tax=Styela clava TaxID=7725 RepID=UPI00193934AD|nr:very-long-chain 3-oxoacyl-CoA reductase-like [Styela clava]
MALVENFVTVVGVLTILRFFSRFVETVARIINESLWSKTFDFKKFGTWAVVTGASDGIGKATSYELAKAGMNLVILARTKSKLDKFADELRQSFNVRVIVIAVDFSNGEDIYDVINEELRDLDIALLVNNVGMAFGKPMSFMDVPEYRKYSTNVVNVNVLAAMKMTEIVLPNMVKKGGGIITNISSLVASMNGAYFSVYGGSKAAINAYTEAMQNEYSNKGIIFQLIAPGLTVTPMALTYTDLKPNLLIPVSELYGKHVVKSLGKSSHTNTGFFGHNVFKLFINLIPDFLAAKINGSEAAKFKPNK